MQRRVYASDLSDDEWTLLAPLIPPAKPGGGPRKHDIPEVFNATSYILRGGCAWRLLPHDFPPRQTVYHYLRLWPKSGLWGQIHTLPRERVRVLAGRDAEPSASVIDSQSVKSTERGGVRGYDRAKKVGGRKRHILVDTTGLLLKARAHAAGITDRNGAQLLLETPSDAFPRLQHIWDDMGYRGKAVEWIKQRLGWTVEVVKQPRRWFRVPEGVGPPLCPRWWCYRAGGWLSARSHGLGGTGE